MSKLERTQSTDTEANELLLNYILLYFSAVEWTGICQRPHHLAKVTLKSFDNLVFIQPSGLRSLRFRDAPRVYYWMKNKFEHLLKQVEIQKKISSENFCLCSPSFLPFNGQRVVDRINSLLAYNALKPYFNCSTNLILWISSPFPYLPYLLSRMEQKVYLIYDLIDDYRLFRVQGSRIFDVEKTLINRADLVFTSSTKLQERVLEFKNPEQVCLMPNGVELEHWTKSNRAFRTDFFQDFGPIIGYFGNIASWLDSEIVLYLARKRPDWQFVFVGPVYKTREVQSLFEIPNIHFLGPKHYEQLPELARNFDVCWIPFKVNSITKSINPVKAYEYLALGKQVVAPCLPDLIGLDPFVLCVSESKDYETLIEFCLSRSEKEEIVSGCKGMAAKYSWEELWAKSKSRISELVLNTDQERA